MPGIDIQDLRAQKLEVVQAAQTLLDKIDSEERDPTEEEETQLDTFSARADALDRQIERRAKLEAHQTALATPQELKAAKRGESTLANRAPTVFVKRDSGKWGFSNFGEYIQAVMVSSHRGNQPDGRLIANAPTTTSVEAVGADGGFAVPPDFRAEISEKVLGEDSFASRCDLITTPSNSVTFPVDETTPWQTSGGIQVYWEGEARQITESKVALQERTIRLNALKALVPISNELLEDAPGLSQWIMRQITKKMDYKLKDGIINGTGVGQPLGIMNSPCLVTIAKESGQAADSLVFENVNHMYARMYAPCRANAVWVINQDLEYALDLMAFPQPSGSTSSYPAYLPAGGLSSSPYGTLKGKPVLPTEAMQTLGDLGDILFADFNSYLLVAKAGGARTDMSMHFFFDYDVQALRVVFRVTGMPWWNAPITRADGTNTLSCFVTLAERA